MDCKGMRTKLQDLLDQTLEPQESAKIRNHLQQCDSCRAEYRQLESIAQAIASLIYFSPSPAFSEKVLTALGLQEAPVILPQWAKWSIGAFGSLISCWTVGITLLISSRLSLWRTIGAFELLANPSQMSILFKLYLAKAALTRGNFVAALHALDRLFGPETANMPFQLVAATAVAGIVMAAISTKAPMSAATRKWRTV